MTPSLYHGDTQPASAYTEWVATRDHPTAGRAEQKPATLSPVKDAAQAERRLALIKRSGLFAGQVEGVSFTRATSEEDLYQAYALVHRAYVAAGYIAPESGGVRLRLFEASATTATFIAKKDDRVIGVLSVVGDSPQLGLPADGAFSKEINALRLAGTRLCEFTNQAVDDEFRRSPVTTELMRCAVAHSLEAGYHGAIAAVSPGHSGAYGLAGFTQIGAERSYSAKIYDPVVALCLNLESYRQAAATSDVAELFMRNVFADRNAYRTKVATWTKQAQATFLNGNTLRRLFVEERNFIVECSLRDMQVLRELWGSALFEDMLVASHLRFDASRRAESRLVQSVRSNWVRRATLAQPAYA